MTLENKLGITDAVELARVEEKLSKAQAHKLFTSGFLDTLEAGSFQALASIHQALFGEICARSQAPAWECSLGSSSFLSSFAKLELRILGSQAGAWEPAHPTPSPTKKTQQHQASLLGKNVCVNNSNGVSR